MSSNVAPSVPFRRRLPWWSGLAAALFLWPWTSLYAQTVEARDSVNVESSRGKWLQPETGGNLESRLGDLLRASVLGVEVRENSGQVGAGQTIRLRGTNSLLHRKAPLLIVDGVRMKSLGYRSFPRLASQNVSPFDDLTPFDIEGVEVLRGPATAAAYGTGGASGVIRITTRRGRPESGGWALQAVQGINELGRVGPVEDETGLGLKDCTAFSSCPESGGWAKSGRTQFYNLSRSDWSPSFDHRTSAYWSDSEGVVGDQGQNRYGASTSLGYRWGEGVNLRATGAFSARSMDWIVDGPWVESFVLNVRRGDQDFSPGHDDQVFLDFPLRSEVQTTYGSLAGSYSRGRTDHQVQASFGRFNSDYAEFNSGEPLHQTFDHTFKTVQAVYSGSLFSSSDRLRFHTSWALDWRGYSTDFVHRRGPTEARFWQSGSVLGGSLQQGVALGDRVTANVGLRVDNVRRNVPDRYGQSGSEPTFTDCCNPGTMWYPFVSASGRLLGGEDRSTVTLRGAVGSSGMAWDEVTARTQEFGERKTEYEVGFDFTTSARRLRAGYTYFHQSGTFTYRRFFPVSGGSELRKGRMRNTGHEVSLSIDGRLGDWATVTQRVALSLANPVTESLVDNVAFRLIDTDWGPMIGNPGIWENIEAFPAICESALDLESGDRQMRCDGPALPPTVLSGAHSATVGPVTAMAQWEYQGGHKRVNETAWVDSRLGIEWPSCEGVSYTQEPDPLEEDYLRCSGSFAQAYWVSDASFLRLRVVSLSLELPTDWIGASVTLTGEGRNLLTSTDYSGIDPEGQSYTSPHDVVGLEYYTLPPLRSFRIGLAVRF